MSKGEQVSSLQSAFNLGSLQECREDTVRVRTGPARTGDSQAGETHSRKMADDGSRFRVLGEDVEAPELTDSVDGEVIPEEID